MNQNNRMGTLPADVARRLIHRYLSGGRQPGLAQRLAQGCITPMEKAWAIYCFCFPNIACPKF